MLATRVARLAFAAAVPCVALAAGSSGFAGAQAWSAAPRSAGAQPSSAAEPAGPQSPIPTGTPAQSPSPSNPDPAAAGAAAAGAAAAGASLVDYYTADRSAAPDRDQLELRLRDDGRAWLVTAPAPPASPAPSATAAPGRFETGTWKGVATGVTVALDSVASVVGGRPLDPHPETRNLTFAFAPCGLTLVAAVPAAGDLGPGGIAFAKRHCR